MKILHTTPAQDGFYMPAEFAPHEGCLMIWPERADSWQYGAYAARKAFLRVIETISESESMTVLCSEGQYDNARAQLPDRVRLVVMETDDAWARDVGPTFVINGRGGRRGIDWGFNAWGGDVDGLYPSWEKDNRVARKFCDLVSNDVYDKRDFICEGGSIHSDGEGTALVTEACLLSAGRNPDLTKAEIEQVLCDYLGASKVIWLPRGIYTTKPTSTLTTYALSRLRARWFSRGRMTRPTRSMRSPRPVWMHWKLRPMPRAAGSRCTSCRCPSR